MSEKLSGDFRKFMDKNFLGAWDVPEDGELVLTIDHVAREEVKNEKGTKVKLTLHFKENYKPMVCNVTNGKAIALAHGSNNVEDWAGKKVTIYVAHDVPAFGGTTDALRIRKYAPKTDEIYCEVCGELITDKTIDGKTYKAKAIANNALTKFGKYMCYDCAAAAKAEQEVAE